jgi:hypothetical protein
MNTKFVMYINSKSDPLDLTLHKVYKLIPDENADKHGGIRVIDDSGEDYLYPASSFVPVQIPQEAEDTFDLQVA